MAACAGRGRHHRAGADRGGGAGRARLRRGLSRGGVRGAAGPPASPGCRARRRPSDRCGSGRRTPSATSPGWKRPLPTSCCTAGTRQSVLCFRTGTGARVPRADSSPPRRTAVPSARGTPRFPPRRGDLEHLSRFVPMTPTDRGETATRTLSPGGAKGRSGARTESGRTGNDRTEDDRTGGEAATDRRPRRRRLRRAGHENRAGGLIRLRDGIAGNGEGGRTTPAPTPPREPIGTVGRTIPRR